MLNEITALLAKELSDDHIMVNAVCPGRVRTDLGGPQAPVSSEQAAETPVWLATLPDNGPTGGFPGNISRCPGSAKDNKLSVAEVRARCI